MDWFLDGIADWLYGLWVDLLNWFSHMISGITTWINEAWAWIISPLYTPLADFLPSIPEFRAIADWIAQSGAVAWVNVVWWVADQIVVVNVVAAALAALAAFALLVWAYRAWMIIKQAVPFAG